METIGKDDYIPVRNMLCGNTSGQDGDIHDDWQVPMKVLLEYYILILGGKIIGVEKLLYMIEKT